MYGRLIQDVYTYWLNDDTAVYCCTALSAAEFLTRRSREKVEERFRRSTLNLGQL
jgi:hypothetical protein